MGCYKVQGKPGEFESVFSPDPLEHDVSFVEPDHSTYEHDLPMYLVGRSGCKTTVLRQGLFNGRPAFVECAAFDNPDDAYNYAGKGNGFV